MLWCFRRGTSKKLHVFARRLHTYLNHENVNSPRTTVTWDVSGVSEQDQNSVWYVTLWFNRRLSIVSQVTVAHCDLSTCQVALSIFPAMTITLYIWTYTCDYSPCTLLHYIIYIRIYTLLHYIVASSLHALWMKLE